MAGWILANDFGGLQAAENAADSNRRQALASAMSAATSGMQFASRQKMQQDQLDQEQENWQKQFGLQKGAADLAKSKQKSDEDWRLAQLDLQDRALGLQGEALDFQKEQGSAAGNREHDLMFQRAMQDAQEGSPSAGPQVTPDYFQTFFPKFSPGETKVLAGTAADTRSVIENQYANVAKAADTLNKFNEFELKQKHAKETLDAFHLGGRLSPWQYDAAKKQKEDIDAAVTTLKPVVDKLKASPLFGTSIMPDTDSGTYQNVAPVPRWLQQPQTQSPSASNPADGWTPTTGGQWLKPKLPALPLSPSVAPLSAPAAQAAVTPAKPKFDPLVYQQANAYLQQGLDYPTALRTALQDFQQAQASGNLP